MPVKQKKTFNIRDRLCLHVYISDALKFKIWGSQVMA